MYKEELEGNSKDENVTRETAREKQPSNLAIKQ